MNQVPVSPNTSQIQLYQALDAYPFDQDQEFQGGLRAILGSVQDPAQIDHLTLRAKCYYYARKAGIPVDFDGYRQWVEDERSGNHLEANGLSDTIAADTAEDASLPPTIHSEAVLDESVTNDGDGAVGGIQEAPKPASFAEICEMIAEGKPIPGIKEIPDTILEGQASESHVTRRKKPWENGNAEAVEVVERPSWLNG